METKIESMPAKAIEEIKTALTKKWLANQHPNPDFRFRNWQSSPELIVFINDNKLYESHLAIKSLLTKNLIGKNFLIEHLVSSEDEKIYIKVFDFESNELVASNVMRLGVNANMGNFTCWAFTITIPVITKDEKGREVNQEKNIFYFTLPLLKNEWS